MDELLMKEKINGKNKFIVKFFNGEFKWQVHYE